MITFMLLACAVTALDPPDGPLEVGHDPWVRPSRLVLSPAGGPVAGGIANVQVNTLEGMNIVGDAASEPSIVVDPTAPLRMAVGWRQFDTIESNFRQAGYSWSVDGGRTWSGRHVIDPGVARSDPVLRGTLDGTFYYLSLRYIGGYDTDLYISEDGGQTWPVSYFAEGGDHAWLAVDQTGGIGHGNLYQRTSLPKSFQRSVDGGVEWGSFGLAQSGPYATADVGPDGTVYDAGSGGQFMQVGRSLDAQDPGVEVPTFTYVGVGAEGGRWWVTTGGAPNPIGLIGQAEVSVDASGGPFHGSAYVLGTWQPDTDVGLYHIGVARSDDGGVTWTEPVVASDPAPVGVLRWFGTLSVAPNGRLDVVFNDHREAPGNPNLTRTYYTFSVDGGQTWSPDEPLGPTWDSWVGWPQNNKIGDYYDMQSDLLGADLIYATTYNGEQDVYFARLGPYDCNGNAIDDEADVADGTSMDCNRNGIPDECEIAAGTLEDSDGDGVADICSCPADFNGDGVLNVLDFVAFQLAWQAGDPSADCDGSGTFDIIDFVCFQNLFTLGCG